MRLDDLVKKLNEAGDKAPGCHASTAVVIEDHYGHWYDIESAVCEDGVVVMELANRVEGPG